MSSKVINISEILKGESAVSRGEGELVYQQICSSFEIEKNTKVFIDFDGLKYVTSAFLNASIGRYLMKFPEREGLFEFSNLSDDWSFRLQRSIRLATNERERNIHNDVTEEMICD